MRVVEVWHTLIKMFLIGVAENKCFGQKLFIHLCEGGKMSLNCLLKLKRFFKWRPSYAKDGISVAPMPLPQMDFFFWMLREENQSLLQNPHESLDHSQWFLS